MYHDNTDLISGMQVFEKSIKIHYVISGDYGNRSKKELRKFNVHL